MKTMKVNVRGETKFCVVVETGEYDQYNKPKIKRFFHSKKNEAVAKAMEFIGNKDKLPQTSNNTITHEVQKVIPLGNAYDELWSTWRIQVNKKEKNPKDKKGISQDTMIRYEDSAKALFKIVPRDTNLLTINKLWVKQFIAKLDSTQSDSQAMRIYAVFHKIMVEAERLDFIDTSPTHAFKELRPSYSSDGKKSVDLNEYKRIYKQIMWSYMKYKSQSSLILLIQANTGARWGEVAALTHADIDFKRNQIHINKAKSKLGNISLTKAGHLRSDQADKGERIVPIAEDFAEVIKDYIFSQKLKKAEYLFDVSYNNSRLALRSACKRAGSTQSETKIFRRFVSSQYHRIGASRDEVRLRLGHNHDATQDIYVTYADQNAVNHANQLHKLIK